MALLRLPLRTKVSVFLGLLALVTTVTLSVVTYTFARTLLLREREDDAQQQAIENAREARRLLEAESDTFYEDFAGRVDAEEDGFYVVVGDDGTEYASELTALDELPAALVGSVEEGTAGMQRFRFDDDLYLAVGIPLTQVDARYFQGFPLDDNERALRVLFWSLAIGSAVFTLLSATVGVWATRRMLHPLDRLSAAASRIAAGDLDTRLAPERDPDLTDIVDSFNGMADAVQSRVQREVRFTSDVSHELRSPITALTAASDVLAARRDELPGRAGQAVDVVVSQVHRFDRMVLDLLELSRLDAGAADLHVETVELAPLIRLIAGHNGFPDVPVDVDPTAPTAARVDRIRFERILANLLANAEHHGGGPVRIAVEVDEPGFVAVAVEDAGPGVPEADRGRIFERFTRGSTSLHRVGTGLGLALVAEHAGALGGRARVEDRAGGGARFVVRLPAGEAMDEDGVA